MIITKKDFPVILNRLKSLSVLAFDTETTGLRPFSGDRVFSIIIAESTEQAYYFNLNPLEQQDLLGDEEVNSLRELFSDPSKFWYAHNAIFDCLMLKESFDIDVRGKVFCTFAQGRVEYNEHMNYSLEASLKRTGGEQKDDRVSKYIKEYGLITKVALDDKKEEYKILHFDRVPLSLISEYALTDARSTLGLGERLNSSIEARAAKGTNAPLDRVKENEMALHHSILRSTQRGILLDVPYIKRAVAYERERLHGATREFETLSGLRYSNHYKTFEKVFSSERKKFIFGEKTKTGQINPIFDESVLGRLDNPLAKEVLKARDAQGKLNFYNSYLFYADKNNVLHPNMVSGGTNTGRFSSNEPNMQNITSEDLCTCKGCGKGYEHITEVCEKCNGSDFERPEFLVRRSFIPRPDYVFFNPDYSSQEYRMMLDMAKRINDSYRERTGLPPLGVEYYELLRKIKEENYDVHQGTADLVGVSRTYAKTVNFALLYGAGVNKMADQLGITSEESSKLRDQYFKALPYVQFFIKTASRTAESRGFAKNWLGRHNYMARDFSYKAPNQLIQGGCADVMKVAMVEVDKMLQATRSHQLLSIHDELIIETHYSDIDNVPKKIIDIMESVYPHNYLPLTASAEWSEISLADKRKGFPTWKNQSLKV
jgi:DNA polymerase-1